MIACEGGFGRNGAGDADRARIGRDRDTVRAQHGFRDFAGAIGGGIHGDDDVGHDTGGKRVRCAKDGPDAAGEKLLFVVRGDENCDVAD